MQQINVMYVFTTRNCFEKEYLLYFLLIFYVKLSSFM
jgi:hypothetical protein